MLDLQNRKNHGCHFHLYSFMDWLVSRTAVCEKSPRSIRSSRKRQQNARPYTPSHSNIGADENVWPDKYVRVRANACFYSMYLQECSVPTTLLPPLASGSDECGVSGCHGANHNVLELQVINNHD